MGTYRIRINDRTYNVSLEAAGRDKFRATLNNEVFEGQSVGNGDLLTWLVRSGNHVVRAQTKIIRSDNLDVWIAGIPFGASIEIIGTAAYGHSMEAPREKRAGGEIRALMPGRITSILVKEGEPVNVGTPLLILEAMKMQNEIVSPMAGQVKSIRVLEAAAVKKDSILVVVE